MSTTVDLGKITASVTVGTTTTGAAGTNASVSNSGTTQDAVLNFTIPRGAQGVQGPQGIQGNTGPAGPTGPQGPMGDVAVITPEQQAAFTMYSVPGQNTDGPMTQKAVTDNLVAGSISYDNSQSGLASNNVQGAVDELGNLLIKTEQGSISLSSLGKYTLDTTTGELVSSASYTCYKGVIIDGVTKIYVTTKKGGSAAGTFAFYGANDILIGEVGTTAYTNKEFDVPTGAISFKVCSYPAGKASAKYVKNVTFDMNGMNAKFSNIDSEISDLDQRVTLIEGDKRIGDVVTSLGYSGTDNYNTHQAIIYTSKFSTDTILSSITTPSSVSDLSCQIIVTNSSYKVTNLYDVTLNGTKTDLESYNIIIPKNGCVGITHANGLSGLTGFKWGSSSYDNNTILGGSLRYTDSVVSIGTSISTQSSNSTNYVFLIKEYTSALNDISKIEGSDELVLTQEDAVNYKRSINASTGEEGTYNDSYSTDYINIKGFKTANLTTNYTANSFGLAFYNSNKVNISGYGLIFKSQSDYTVLIPSNAEYLRFSVLSGKTLSLSMSATGVNGFVKEFNDMKETVDELASGQGSDKKLSILAVGNSFTQNPMNNMPTLLTNLGVDNINISYLFHAGRGLDGWYNAYKTNESNTAHTVCGNSFSGNNVAQVFAHDWDIITFQQASGDSNNYSTFIPYLAGLIQAAKRHCTNKNVKIGWQLTWSRWSGVGGALAGETGWTNIVNTVKSMLADYGLQIDYVIPSGTAIQNARGTSLNTEHELTADGSHLSAGVGEFVATCTWYSAIIEQFTNVPLESDTVTTIDVSSVTQDYEAEAVTNENRALCQRCATFATASPFKLTASII